MVCVFWYRDMSSLVLDMGPELAAAARTHDPFW